MNSELKKIGPFTARFYFLSLLAISIFVYPLSYFFSDIISQNLGFIWPNSQELSGFCEKNQCPFESKFVIALYVIQILLYISFILFCTVTMILSKPQNLKLDKIFLIWFIVFSWSLFLLQGVFGDLSFQKNNIFYYNSVSSSGIGIIRLTVIGIFSSFWAFTAIL